MQFNKVILEGTLVKVDKRDSGATMIWVAAGNRQEVPVPNAPLPTFFTGVIAVRVPAYVQKKLREDFFDVGMEILVEARLQGVRREVDGSDYYVVEVQASRLHKDRNGDMETEEEHANE